MKEFGWSAEPWRLCDGLIISQDIKNVAIICNNGMNNGDEDDELKIFADYNAELISRAPEMARALIEFYKGTASKKSLKVLGESLLRMRPKSDGGE